MAVFNYSKIDKFIQKSEKLFIYVFFGLKKRPKEKIFSFCQILFKYPTFVKKIKR